MRNYYRVSNRLSTCMSENFSVKSTNLQARGEIGPEDGIEVQFSRPVDRKSAQTGFSLTPDVRGNIAFEEDDTVARFTPLETMSVGEYTLHLEEIADVEGRLAIDPVRVGFVVSEETGPDLDIPESHVVLSRSRAALSFIDRELEVVKVWDPKQQAGYEIGLDESGQRVDHEELLVEEYERYYETYGKIHPVLFEAMESSRGRLPVALWIDFDEDVVDKSEFDLDELRERPGALVAYRERVERAREEMAERLAERFQVEVAREEVLETVPVIRFEADSGTVRELAELDEVGALFLDEEEGIDDLSASMQVSNADDVVDTQGWRGTDIRVGIWEGGPDDLSDLDIEEHYDGTRSVQSDHARLVTSIVRNDESGTPDGYAPDSKVYAANKYSKKALEWAVTGKECRAINQSFHRNSEPKSGLLSFDDVLKDYLVLHYPYPFIAQAAGNYWNGDADNISPPSDEYVNHKGYNSMAIGNHNDSASTMSGSSVFRNPDPPGSFDDRELPELSANGVSVDAVDVSKSGTSFASPAVAGSAALLQNMDNLLLWWPEGIRAILLASAGRNISGRSWQEDLWSDGVDGAGALDVDAAGRIALNRRGENNSASPRGYDVGRLSASDFDSAGRSRFEYRIRVPNDPDRTRVKVALAWNGEVDTWSIFGIRLYLSSNLEMDYDLHIYDDRDNLVAWSSSWDNSYEIAEFDADPGRTYTARIREWSGSGGSWYGLAWTVH